MCHSTGCYQIEDNVSQAEVIRAPCFHDDEHEHFVVHDGHYDLLGIGSWSNASGGEIYPTVSRQSLLEGLENDVDTSRQPHVQPLSQEPPLVELKHVLTGFEIEFCALVVDLDKKQSPSLIEDELHNGHNAFLRAGRASWNKKAISNVIEDKTETDDPEPVTEMLLQPQTRPISHDQLGIEVKGINTGLTMVEAKCIHVDEKQSILAQKDPSRRKSLTNDQWQSLIALHKQLLHEHHDFFLVSQHPAASFNLRKLAAKYSMPARMRRHGIHAFLEVLRHRLPGPLEHMLAFVHIAYSMMALLYETVPTFENTWIECLGDLGKYRMAIEDEGAKDEQIWSGVARFWYSKAANKTPTIGRLHHHLAILARPSTLKQLSLYTRSLISITPFESARGGIMALFNPILSGLGTTHHKSSSIELHKLVDKFIESNGPRFRRNGVFLAVSALFESGVPTLRGNHKSILHHTFDRPRVTEKVVGTSDISSNRNDWHPGDFSPSRELNARPVWPETLTQDINQSNIIISKASDLIASMFELVPTESNDHRYIPPVVYAMLGFICCISSILDARKLNHNAIPWTAMCYYLNHLPKHESFLAQNCMVSSNENTSNRPLPEDFILRGQLYTQTYFPENWFRDAMVDDKERMLEQSSHDTYRTVRMPSYDEATPAFLTTDEGVSHQGTVWASVRVPYISGANWSIRERAATSQTGAFELGFRSAMKSWSCRLARRHVRLVSLFSQLILLASCFRFTVALPTPLNTPSTAAEDGSPALGSLSADIASLSLVLLVPGVAELLVRLKRMSAIPVHGTLMSTMAFGWWCSRNDATVSYVLLWSIFIIWGVSSVRFWKYAFQKPSTPAYTLLVVIFMAMVLDIVMVHYMTAAGTPMSQGDVLNLCLPSASLALGTTATVLAAHQQHHFERPAANSFERPIEEQFGRSTSDRFGTDKDIKQPLSERKGHGKPQNQASETRAHAEADAPRSSPTCSV